MNDQRRTTYNISVQPKSGSPQKTRADIRIGSNEFRGDILLTKQERSARTDYQKQTLNHIPLALLTPFPRRLRATPHIED